jgi:hypothetical protein
MRIERPKCASSPSASETLPSFFSKVRRKATNIEGVDYHPFFDDYDSLPLRPSCKLVRKSKTFSTVDTVAKHNMVHNIHHTYTHEESRDDELDKKLLARDNKQLADRCQVIEISSIEEGKPYHYTATEKWLLLPGLVDFGGSSRQGPKSSQIGSKPCKKKVHFSTVKVTPYQRDYNCDKNVYYNKRELSNISKQRYEDAAKLRKESLFCGEHKKDLTPTLLSFIFDPNDDIYKRLSSRGIEHHVYPELRREIIRKNKEARAKILKYVRSGPFDPDGSKLRERSEQFSRWARELAIEKAKSYAMNNALIDPKKKEEPRMSMEGKSTAKHTLKLEDTILQFKKVKVSLHDVEADLGKTSHIKCSGSKQKSENTTSCTLVEL